MGRDNPSGADNQQERPGVEQWTVGFVDGEGCFSISVVRNPGCRLGWQVQHEFFVTQASPSRAALELLRQAGVRVRRHHRAAPRGRSSCSVVSFQREAARGARCVRGAVLRRTSIENREACRLRAVRHRPGDDGTRRTLARRRTATHRFHHGDDESQAAVSVPGILRGHTPAGSHRWRVEDMVLASWRHEGN